MTFPCLRKLYSFNKGSLFKDLLKGSLFQDPLGKLYS
jgi:hypothetical protein